MQQITAEELRNFLKENNYFLRFNNKIEILAENVREMGVAGELSVTLPVDARPGDKILIDLVAQFKTMDVFIDEMNINTIGDLQDIRRVFCWSQYRKGNGFVNCTVLELDGASICFRVQHGITIVYSTDLHYYDELETTLTSPDQFVQYIEERIERLGTYAALVMERGGFMKL